VKLIRGSRACTLLLVASAATVSCAVGGCRAERAGTVPATGATESDEAARAIREAALASARVWQPPAVPIGQAILNTNPPGADFGPDDEVNCRFNTKRVGGTTPKFHCDLGTGETVKLKYGKGNPELNAEVATTRLLTALGFFADRMFVVRQVRCAGCPAFPFQSLRCLDRFGLKAVCFPRGINYDRVVDFPAAVIERKLDGRVIEATTDQGWGWYELEKVDPARGGSSRTEVDAFRLMAVFLAHWDNKDANQRLVCPAGADRPAGGCAAPIALMQDVGATFGPTKVDLHNWRQTRVWKDGASCLVSMEHLPWGGGTFPESRISDKGRQHLLGLLTQLSDAQLRDLFDDSGITAHDQVSAEARSAAPWIAVFKDKVKQIRDGGPCPS
jgi:hypothetical protein